MYSENHIFSKAAIDEIPSVIFVFLSFINNALSLFHRKAVKATLVLLPLLGITYMLFFVNPGEDDISQIVFIYFNSFLQSFQVRTMCLMQCDADLENLHMVM